MKSLILAACLLVATMVSTVTATEFCPSGEISTNVTIALDTPGATHTIASGCIIAPEMNIIINASMNAGTTSSSAATVTISQVNIGRRDVVIFTGATSEIAQTRFPYIINIVNNQFGNDAAIFFRGALPPASVVTVSGNRFNASTPLGQRMPSPFSSVSTWAACIIFYDLTLFSAKVFVTQNNIYGSDIAGNYNIIGVYVYTQIFFMADGSQFSVSQNNITTICNPIARNGICGYGVMTSSLYIYAKGEYNVNDNTFNSAGCLINNVPNLINPSLPSEANGKITFSGNRGILNTMYLPHTIDPKLQPFMMFNSINIQQHSSIEVLNNNFDISGTSGMFGFSGDFNFFENSTITIASNRLVTRDCTPGIYFEEHSTADTSRVRILNNDFYRDDDTNIDAPLLYFGKSFGLKFTATLTVAYNKFGGRSVPSTAMIMDMSAAAVNAFTFANDARLYACGNVLGGTALLTTSQVWPTLHNSLRARVLVTGCSGTPLPTNISAGATTTAARTTARNGATTTAFPVPTTNANSTNSPLGNHVAGRHHGCLLAVLAALCIVGAIFQ